jgi:surface protein
MKTSNSKPYPSKTNTVTSTNVNTNINTSTEAPVDHGGNVLEEPKGLWSQLKVQRLIFFLCLIVVGVHQYHQPVRVAPSAGPSSRASTSASRMPFETTGELRSAVDYYLADNSRNTLVARLYDYLADNSRNTLVARTYGWPIGVWDVSKIQDFSFLFSAIDFGNSDRFNPDAATFNEDISSWTMSSATSMIGMFGGATSFNQPIGNWTVSSVTRMDIMFASATSFNQPIGHWNVSSVTSMNSIFAYATSFDAPLDDWNVSSVMDMRSMFNGATSFNQSLGNWNVSRSATLGGRIFWNSGCPPSAQRNPKGKQSCFYVI